MVGYGGTQICLTGKKQGETVCGNWEHGNRAISEGNKDTPVPPRGTLTVFKENPAASHMTIQMLLLILAYLFFIL